MRLFARAKDTVPSKPTPGPDGSPLLPPASAFYTALDLQAITWLGEFRKAGTIKADFYWELGGRHPIMWAVTPCTMHTARYYPQEFTALVRSSLNAGLDLTKQDDWEKLGRCYGH